MVKIESKSLSGKYSQKPLYHAKQSATDALKTSSNKVIHKTAERAGHLINNEIAKKVTKFSKNLEKVTNENDKEIPKERYISPETGKKLLMI